MNVMEQRVIGVEACIQDLMKLRDKIQRLHEAGRHLPEDVQTKACICHLIATSDTEA